MEYGKCFSIFRMIFWWIFMIESQRKRKEINIKTEFFCLNHLCRFGECCGFVILTRGFFFCSNGFSLSPAILEGEYLHDHADKSQQHAAERIVPWWVDLNTSRSLILAWRDWRSKRDDATVVRTWWVDNVTVVVQTFIHIECFFADLLSFLVHYIVLWCLRAYGQQWYHTSLIHLLWPTLSVERWLRDQVPLSQLRREWNLRIGWSILVGRNILLL